MSFPPIEVGSLIEQGPAGVRVGSSPPPFPHRGVGLLFYEARQDLEDTGFCGYKTTSRALAIGNAGELARFQCICLYITFQCMFTSFCNLSLFSFLGNQNMSSSRGALGPGLRWRCRSIGTKHLGFAGCTLAELDIDRFLTKQRCEQLKSCGTLWEYEFLCDRSLPGLTCCSFGSVIS